MKKLLVGAVIWALPLMSSAEELVSPVDQATIYLNAAENNALGLVGKLNGNLQYYACRDVEVLKLTNKALSVPTIEREAVKINRWIRSNLSAAMENIEKLSALCNDQLTDVELPEAKLLAGNIAAMMSME